MHHKVPVEWTRIRTGQGSGPFWKGHTGEVGEVLQKWDHAGEGNGDAEDKENEHDESDDEGAGDDGDARGDEPDQGVVDADAEEVLPIPAVN